MQTIRRMEEVKEAVKDFAQILRPTAAGGIKHLKLEWATNDGRSYNGPYDFTLWVVKNMPRIIEEYRIELREGAANSTANALEELLSEIKIKGLDVALDEACAAIDEVTA